MSLTIGRPAPAHSMQATVEVGDVVPLLGEVGHRLRGPGTDPADDHRPAVRDVGQPLHELHQRNVHRSPRCGRAPTRPARARRARSRPRAAGLGGRGGRRYRWILLGRLIGSLRAASTCGGRRAACRRSGRWRSTAGSSRRRRPLGPRRRRPGTSGRCGRARAMWDFFSPLSSLAASPRERSTASPRTPRIAAYSVSTLGLAQAVRRLERRHLRGVQELVGVGVADAGDRALVPQHALELGAAGVVEDPAQHARS